MNPNTLTNSELERELFALVGPTDAPKPLHGFDSSQAVIDVRTYEVLLEAARRWQANHAASVLIDRAEELEIEPEDAAALLDELSNHNLATPKALERSLDEGNAKVERAEGESDTLREALETARADAEEASQCIDRIFAKPLP